MTPAKLRDYRCKDLAQMAKKEKVPGWHAMRKEELVQALAKAKRRRTASSRSGGKSSTAPSKNGVPQRRLSASNRSNGVALSNGAAKRTSPTIRRRIDQMKSKMEAAKNLSVSTNGRRLRDRLVVMVRDPYWLHAYWELTPQSIQRAQAALSQAWHGCRPVLRLFTVSEDGMATPLRDIEIHGGVSNWYVDVYDPPQDFRLEIGYRTADNGFYCLARSNMVSTPPAGTSDALDENWADVAENADRIFAMSGGYSQQGTSQELQELLEERLRRPIGSPMTTRFGLGAGGRGQSNFHLAVDAELIVYGVSSRDAHVTLKGEPVQLRQDGTFTVRLNMPDRRQVIPVVASTGDGGEQRTIILAIERNTKVMEPVIRDVTSL
jgi:uncharacterized protein